MVKENSPPVVLTVGHSTQPLAEFIALLAARSVSRLVDVRTVPCSRHNPQFNRDILPTALEIVGIRYEHAADLGRFRPTLPGSLNTGWRNVSFRGFADYMQTPEFAENLAASSNRQRASESCSCAPSRAVALPSLADRRRVGGPRHLCQGNHQRGSSSATHVDLFCQSGRHRNHLSAASASTLNCRAFSLGASTNLSTRRLDVLSTAGVRMAG
jgi:hypothetical protein